MYAALFNGVVCEITESELSVLIYVDMCLSFLGAITVTMDSTKKNKIFDIDAYTKT